MTSFARAERNALCDLLLELGDAAPTLCAGWTTRDLAAHLVVRESSPAAIGILVKPLASITEAIQRRIARRPWPELVDAVRHPPFYAPLGWGPIDARANLSEFFVHHEDVRRAQPGWQPRELAPGQQRALWAVLRSQAAALYRNAPGGVTLRRPDGEELQARPGGSDADADVVVAGPVPELLLHAFGRTAHAEVVVTGSAAATAALDETDLGF